jgi:GAF domain-containing protein
MAALQRVAEQLLIESGGSRVTLRLDLPGEDFPVVAEAVTHGARQIKGDRSVGNLRGAATVQYLDRERKSLIQEDLRVADPPVPKELIDVYGAQAQMLAPIIRNDQLVGIVSVHYVRGPRQWTDQEVDKLGQAQSKVMQILSDEDNRKLKVAGDALRDAAIETILDQLREAMSVQRCTLRQDVLEGYAFPVTHESRAEGVNPLLGDFTIIQTGQPVIERLLAERSPVVQTDSRNASTDPAFQAALDHYGGMGAQIVTPLFSDDRLIGVVSVHYLRGTRTWSSEETELALFATQLIGRLIKSSP